MRPKWTRYMAMGIALLLAAQLLVRDRNPEAKA